MIVRITFSVLLLGGLLLAPRVSATAQVEELPRGGWGVLEARENSERIEQEKRNREREYAREKELREPKPTGCQTGQFCLQSIEAIQSHRVPGTGLMAVLHDIDLGEDALTVRMRFYNEGTETATLALDPNASYEAFYVEVDGEKSFILRDEDGDLEAKESFAGELDPGEMESWWARFPPLASHAVSFDIEIQSIPRFQGVLVSNR
ncbi:MAG TPA: hypothetical protein VFM44_11235 [Gemmatimonadota bacterium]|nr:hypothetical protein [Gemmatimonadota bacterium]